MPELHDILIAGLTGFLAGLLLSIPVGPVNLTILNEAARRGFRWAMLISLGASAMECIYCFIAFTGFASFFERGIVKASMELFSFVFMLFLGHLDRPFRTKLFFKSGEGPVIGALNNAVDWTRWRSWSRPR